jgi:hypothetical protein
MSSTEEEGSYLLDDLGVSNIQFVKRKKNRDTKNKQILMEQEFWPFSHS